MDREALLTEADRCVKCGLCLPHCPTYRISRDEGDSPRGRIALMQGLVQGQVDTPKLHQHLDRCLGCLACERACPSGVNYGDLIDAVRSIQNRRRTGLSRFGLYLLSRAPYLELTSLGLRLYHWSRLQMLVRRIGGRRLRRLDALLPKPTDEQSTIRTCGASARRVALFTGCIGNLADRPALLATVKLLGRLGFSVVIPPQQVCCGALHQHNGHPQQAKQLAARNQRAFDAESCDAILFLASGCGAQLLDYAKLGYAFSTPVMDVCEFLLRQPGMQDLPWRALARPVLLHTPCSAKLLPGKGSAAGELLRLIPGLEILTPRSEECCGAAGSYILLQPELADRLRQPLLTEATRRPLHAVVTSNTGCALHLAAGLKSQEPRIPVLHPLELLLQQLDA